MAWTIRLCRHVATMHQSGVAHGNISPACVLVTRTDPRSRGMMSDVARTAESLPFHSPERIRGGGVSPGDDAWAIAATLYTLLTSSPPFVGMDRGELEQQILRANPAPLSVFGVDDEAIEQVIADAFTPEIGRRITSVAEMHRRLEQLLPDAHSYPALDDEDDEDTGAQHASAVEHDGGDRLFAPEEVRPTGDPKAPGGPIGEQDETVMRELPAHIIAMAARAAAGSSPPPAPVAGRPPPPVQAPAPRLHDIEGAVTRIAGRDGDATRIAPARVAPPRMQSDVDDEARTGESRGRPSVAPSSRRQQVLEPPRPRPGFAAPSSGPVSSSPPPLDPDDVRTVMHGAIPMARVMGAAPNPVPAAPATQPHHPGAPVLSPAPQDRPPPPPDDDDDGGRTVLRESPLLRPPGGPMPPGGAISPQWKPAAPPRTASGSFPAPTSAQLRASPATQLSPGSTQRPGPADVGYGHTLASPQGLPPQAPGPQGDVSNLIQETLESMGRSGAFPPPTGPAPSMPQPMLSAQPPAMPMQPMGMQPSAMQPSAMQGMPQSMTGQPMSQPMPAMQSMHPGLPPHLQPQVVGPQSFAPPMGDAQRSGSDTFQGNITGSDEIEMMRRGRGTGRLIFICLLVLMVAAGVTFALLKYGPAYGIHVPLP